MPSIKLPDCNSEDEPHGELEAVLAEGPELAADPSLLPLTSEFRGDRELATSLFMNPIDSTDQAQG